MNIHIRDSNFFSIQYPDKPNPYINWIWDREPSDNDITVFTDSHIQEVITNKSKIKIAMIFEPPVINSFPYSFVKENYRYFDYVMTFDESLMSISSNIVYYSCGATWIGESDRKIYEKNKMVSIIASHKNWTQGHILRHSAVSKYGNRMDVMGNGYRQIPSKLEGLAPYRYSITIENSKFNSYFTEKLMDCLVTGVVPVYWGCPRIGDFFDLNGFILFDSVDDLDIVLSALSEEDYNSRMDAIVYNFRKASEYLYPEKYLLDLLEKRF